MAGGGYPHAYPPRGLSRIDAALYLGIGLHLFDDMVKDGRLPPPKKLNSRVIFDRIELDVAFQGLPVQERDTRTLSQKMIDGE